MSQQKCGAATLMILMNLDELASFTSLNCWVKKFLFVEELASTSNSVELAIETKGTTDAGTAAVQRHSERCEPLNPNRNMELKHLPCRFPNNFTMRFVFVPWHNKTATWSNIVHQLLPFKTASSWDGKHPSEMSLSSLCFANLRLLRLSQRSCQRLQRQQRS